MDFKEVETVFFDGKPKYSISIGDKIEIGIVKNIYYHHPQGIDKEHYVDIVGDEGKEYRFFKFDGVQFKGLEY